MFDQLFVIGLFVLYGLALIYFGDNSSPYPPLDEHGRPMMGCFSSRSGRFMWVSSPISKKEE